MSIFREFLEFRRWKREQRRWRETHKVPREHQCCALRADLRGNTNMWRVVAIVALSLSGCVSTKPFDQAFGAEQGRQIVKSEIAFFLSGQVSAEPTSQLR